MKRAIVLISAFVVCMMTYAQYGKETLYLNNGNVVKGMITEEVYGESITIKREDGSIVTYKISDIQKKRRELPNDISTEKKKSRHQY